MFYTCPVTNRELDPLKVRRRLLLESRGQINDWLAEYRGADELASLAAEEKVVAVARKALGFGDETDDQTVIDALASFNTYLRGKGQRGLNSPSSAESTVSPRTSPTKTDCG